jgi:serine protease Do
MISISDLRNKNLDLFMAPVLVLLFAALLAMMYGWVGTSRSIGGEMAEPPEGQWVAAQGPVVQPGTAQQAHHLPAPVGVGIGNGADGQMQLINIPPGTAQQAHHLPAPVGVGIGNGADGQMQLINARPPVYLGVKLGAVTDALAATFGLTTTRGLHVQEVARNTPADKAGLQLDDVLLSVDRQPVQDLDQLFKILSAKQVGDTIKIVYFRHGKQKTGYLTLASPPDLLPAAANVAGGLAPLKTIAGPGWLGVEVQNIDAVIETQFKLADRRGVIISFVTPQSPAAQAGLIEGDVIVRCNQVKIKDVQRFKGLLAKVKAGDLVKLRIIRAGQEQDLTLAMGDSAKAPVLKPGKLPPAEMLVEGSWIGMDVSELMPKDAADFGFPAGTSGVLVNDVEGPPALDVGFQTGDLIIAINSTPTPTMRDFVKGSRQQNGAVVDVMRGNRHLFITVPPPGFSQQGTALSLVPNNNFQQVAAIQVSPGRLAIIATAPSLGAPVAGEQLPSASLLIVDPVENSFTSMPLPNFNQMQDVIKDNQVVALISNNLSARSAAGYAVNGVTVYNGVVGTADQVLGLYRTGSLIAMK